MQELDAVLFRAANGFVGKSAFFDTLVVAAGAYSQFVLIAALFIFAVWKLRRERAAWKILVWGLGAAGAARFALKPLIVWFVGRARPFVVLSDTHVLIMKATNEYWNSFPSGHAVFFFALSTVLYRFDRKVAIGFFAASILMGIARIVAGVHWPSDIAGGAAIGIAVGMAANAMRSALERRRTPTSV